MRYIEEKIFIRSNKNVRLYNLFNFNNFIYYIICRRFKIMREVEEKILKGLEHDIKMLKKTGHTIEDIIECLIIFKEYSNDNTEEYKKEIDKLMEG